MCAYVFEYIEDYTKFTKEEKEEEEKKKRGGKVDLNQKPEFIRRPGEKNIKFGMWGNVSGKGAHHKKNDFTIV